MSELRLRVEIPAELKPEFEAALEEVVRRFLRALEFAVADELLSKSKMTDELASKLGDELKERVARRHGLVE